MKALHNIIAYNVIEEIDDPEEDLILLHVH